MSENSQLDRSPQPYYVSRMPSLSNALSRCTLWLIVILGCLSCADKFEHNPNLAAQKAEEFATLAWVKQDYNGAYALVADGLRRHVSLDQFKQTLTRNPSATQPARIVAREYEPMSGEKAIYIYLTGEDGGGPSNYRITMEGSAGAGYTVLRFDNAGFNLSTGERKKLAK